MHKAATPAQGRTINGRHTMATPSPQGNTEVTILRDGGYVDGKREEALRAENPQASDRNECKNGDRARYP